MTVLLESSMEKTSKKQNSSTLSTNQLRPKETEAINSNKRAAGRLHKSAVALIADNSVVVGTSSKVHCMLFSVTLKYCHSLTSPHHLHAVQLMRSEINCQTVTHQNRT